MIKLFYYQWKYKEHKECRANETAYNHDGQGTL